MERSAPNGGFPGVKKIASTWGAVRGWGVTGPWLKHA